MSSQKRVSAKGQIQVTGPSPDPTPAVSSLNTGRRNHATTTLNGLVYAIGGESNTNTYEDTVEQYDPATDTWTQVASLNTPRRFLAAAVVDNPDPVGLNIVAAGGESQVETISTATEVYLPGSDTWQSKTDLPFGRKHHAAHGGYEAGNSHAFFFSGKTFETLIAPTNAYLDDNWTVSPDIPTPRKFLAAAQLGDYVYTIGGESSENTYTDVVDVYDLVNSEWKNPAASLSIPRRYHAVASDGNKLYAIGGESANSSYLNSVEAYIPSKDWWMPHPPIETARSRFGATGAGGDVYVISGETSGDNFLTSVEQMPEFPPAVFTPGQDTLIAFDADNGLLRNTATELVIHPGQAISASDGDDIQWVTDDSTARLYSL